MLDDNDLHLLRRLLDICDETEALSDALHGEVRPAERRRLRSRHREQLDDLYATLESEDPEEGLPGFLREFRNRFGLTTEEVLLLVVLLHRRIAAPDPIVSGRVLLSVLSDSPFDILLYARLLQTGSKLLSSGLINAHVMAPEGVLEGEFRITERLYRQIYREVHGIESTPPKPEELPPYASPVEHLLDWRYVVNQRQRLAAVLFPQSYWAEVSPPGDDRAEDLVDYIELVREIVSTREVRSGEVVDLPLSALTEEFELEDDERLIIVALLFQELTTSSPIVDANELLRLVCEREDEIFLKRHLLGAKSKLVENGLVTFDRDLEDKELLAGVYLPEWVTERLLPKFEDRKAINNEERRRFHEYLKRLEGSDDFYNNL